MNGGVSYFYKSLSKNYSLSAAAAILIREVEFLRYTVLGCLGLARSWGVAVDRAAHRPAESPVEGHTSGRT